MAGLEDRCIIVGGNNADDTSISSVTQDLQLEIGVTGLYPSIASVGEVWEEEQQQQQQQQQTHLKSAGHNNSTAKSLLNLEDDILRKKIAASCTQGLASQGDTNMKENAPKEKAGNRKDDSIPAKSTARTVVGDKEIGIEQSAALTSSGSVASTEFPLVMEKDSFLREVRNIKALPDQKHADSTPARNENIGAATISQPGAIAVLPSRAFDEEAPDSNTAGSSSTSTPAPSVAFVATLSPHERNQHCVPHRPFVIQAEAPTLIPAANVVRDVRLPKRRVTRFWLGTGAISLMMFIVVLLSLGLAGVLSPSDQEDTQKGNGTMITPSSPSLTTPLSLLDQIRERGFLECYESIFSPFLEENAGSWAPSFCLAVAAAIWGKETYKERVHFVPFGLIPSENARADINPYGLTRSMMTDNNGKQGALFTAPFFIDGTRVAGDPVYVDCFDNKDIMHVDECSDLKLCYAIGTAWEALAHSVLPERRIIGHNSFLAVAEAFSGGKCNLLFMFSISDTESLVRTLGYTGNYTVGTKSHTRDSRALITDPSDPEFADFTNIVLQALQAAAQHGITQVTAELMPQTEVFGKLYKNMFRNVIGAVGNYAELHSRYLGAVLHGDTVNTINDGSTGLMFAHDVAKQDPNVNYILVPGSRLRQVLDRGELRCGVRYGRPGFGVKSKGDPIGIDIDYCRAIGASLFEGDQTSVKLVEIVDQRHGFQSLASGEIDVMTGATWNLENDVHEPTTDLGFAFSQPYFFNPSVDTASKDPNLCLATMQDEYEWTTFVFWVTTSLIYAEEKSIKQMQYNEMPLAYNYGEDLKRMFRSAVLSVGNYGEVYARNLEAIVPRSGRNFLNPAENPGPALYPMPGIL